jgi:serine/threonine-protein kinase
MPENIGRFEILSEIAHSDSAHVYKASDPESGQTVALKVLDVSSSSEQSAALVQRVLTEAESTKVLSSHNIAVLYGAGEIDGKFCAATDYVQGKSIAGMLSQHESFSIWDLLDVARQACQALDHAHARKVVHSSLEPAKVLVTWDGTVKILGFGISTMGASAARASGKVPEILRYMSPEQVRGEALDGRSNLFTLGAILYEMVTDRKAFGGDNAEQVRQEIEVGMPVAPAQIHSKLQPGLSELIMKALAKSPDQRYQSGQDLVADLESCKENTQKAAAPRKMPKVTAREEDGETPETAEPVRIVEKRASAAVAAAAGSGSPRVESVSPSPVKMSAAVAPAETEKKRAPLPEEPKPVRSAGKRPSFSEVDSLPPLKEIYVAPPPPAPEPAAEAEIEPVQTVFSGAPQEEKSKTPPSEMVKNAVAEIRKIPPRLFLYSVGAAVCIILLVLGVVLSRIHSESAEENAPAAQTANANSETQAPATAEPGSAVQTTPVPMPAASQANETGPDVISVKPKRTAKPKIAKVAPPPAPVTIPGQLSVSSTPEGAQVLVDGHHNPTWLTPFDLAGLGPGQHLVSVSKPGYSTENRTIDVASGSKSFLVVQLAPVGATALISSVPPGAEVFMDGRDTGRATPAQISVDKIGSHIFTLRKTGYLEETTTATLAAGQSFQYGPVLRALGVTDDIKLGGKFKKIFGGSETAGMGTVSVRTQPKGAQIAVNHHVLDKGSPVDFYLNPGTYIIDITSTGYKNVERVINVDRGGKVTVDEVMELQ